MKIKVKLFASLRQERFDEKEFEIDEGSDVDFLLKKFRFKHEEVNIVFINGIHADYNTILNDGDNVAFFPLLGGG
jgi:molybdopterin converting factor small subunit